MKKTIYLLCSLVLVSCNLKSPDNSNVTEETTTIQSDSIELSSEEEIIMQDSIEEFFPEIKFIPPIMVDEEPFEQSEPKTTPSRTIIIKIVEDEYADTEIYYYSPRMENEDYSYRKELGRNNNFVGSTDIDNLVQITIPDTCEQGAKLMLHTVGYELVEIDINDISDENYVEVELTPVVYNSRIFLESTYYRDIEIINIINVDEESRKVFYGRCLPIYDGHGGHADPICAFRCMGCTPRFKLFFSTEISIEEKRALYKAISEGEKCSFLITVDKGRITNIEIEEFPQEELPELRRAIQDKQWRLNHEGRKLQVRVSFAIREKQQEK